MVPHFFNMTAGGWWRHLTVAVLSLIKPTEWCQHAVQRGGGRGWDGVGGGIQCVWYPHWLLELQMVQVKYWSPPVSFNTSIYMLHMGVTPTVVLFVNHTGSWALQWATHRVSYTSHTGSWALRWAMHELIQATEATNPRLLVILTSGTKMWMKNKTALCIQSWASSEDVYRCSMGDGSAGSPCGTVLFLLTALWSKQASHSHLAFVNTVQFVPSIAAFNAP